MKRSSQAAIRLSKALVKAGRPATPRRLERWSQDGLGPVGNPGFAVPVDHYGEVASLSRSGPGRRYGRPTLSGPALPLRAAILAELGLSAEPPTVIPSALDLSVDPSGDTAFAAVEPTAQAMVADPGGLPPLLVKVIRALYRNAAQRAERLGEPAEVIFFSSVVNGLVHLLGGNFYNAPAIEAVLGFEADTVSDEVLEVLNSKLRMSIPAIDLAYLTVPVEDISVMAERLTAGAPHLLCHLEVTGADQGDIEDLAVLIAPFRRLLREPPAGGLRRFSRQTASSPGAGTGAGGPRCRTEHALRYVGERGGVDTGGGGAKPTRPPR